MSDPIATIRQAYLYIAAYERRILDSVDVVDEAVREAGFERTKPRRWSPIYASFPTRAYAPELPVWNNLPNYAMRYEWFMGEPNTAGNLWVLVDHVADTTAERRWLSGTPVSAPSEDLTVADDAHSVLRWHIVTFASALPSARYGVSWNKLIAMQTGQQEATFLFTGGTDAPVERGGEFITHVQHCVDVAELVDADALQRRFVRPLLDALGGARG